LGSRGRRQEDHEFGASLGYIARHCLKKENVRVLFFSAFKVNLEVISTL
jgi:hypothetical protein